MISLDPDKEHLRKTIFWKTFHKSMMFDTYENAQNYRKQLISLRKEPPSTFYSRDGHRITPDGVMDPTKSSGSRAPEKLDFIFGQQPSENLAEFKKIEADLNLMDDLKGSLTALHAKIKDFVEKESEWIKEKEECEEKLRQLKAELGTSSDQKFSRASSQLTPQQLKKVRRN